MSTARLGQVVGTSAARLGQVMGTLQRKRWVSPDSCLLRFTLPDETPTLGLPAPSGVKVHGKSYSPISLPDARGYVDLLVKSYASHGASDGAAVGEYLCTREVGETVEFHKKAPRDIHGSAVLGGRWRHVGLIGGGTGVAPLIQIARSLLADASERAHVHMLAIHRTVEDILMKAELDAFAAANPDRLRVSYALTEPDSAWTGGAGRGDVGMLRAAGLSDGLTDEATMCFVCGTAGFVDHWAGGIERVDGRKVQGTLRGVLSQAGFDASQVYKF